MARGEAEVALFAGLADEPLDVSEPTGSGPDRFGAGGVDGRGAVLFDQVAEPQDGAQRLGAARIEGRTPGSVIVALLAEVPGTGGALPKTLAEAKR